MRKIKSKMIRPVFLFLFLCFGLNLFAQYSIKDDERILTKKEQKSLQKMIDYQLEFYNKAFPDSAVEKSSVKLTIYNSHADYLVRQKENYGYNIENSPGFYSGKNKEIIVSKEKCKDYFLEMCYHELSHFFMAIRTCGCTFPIWLNEGLAEYFENIKLSKTIKHKRNIYHAARVKTMLELKDFNLRDFIDWSYEKFRDISFTQDSYGYALAYCIVAFLMQNEETMIAVINHIYKGKSSYEALDSVYKGGFEAFEQDLIQSMGKLKSPKINPDFIYALPVKTSDSIQAAPQKNSKGFTLVFDLSSAGDTIYACREGCVHYEWTSKVNMENNRMIIKHKDDSFSEYSQFEKLLVSQGNCVKLGQPIAINTGKNLSKVIGLAIYYVDKNKAGRWYTCSHIVPVFHTLNAGDIKLEENTTYIGEINEYLKIQEMNEKYEKNKKKNENR